MIAEQTTRRELGQLSPQLTTVYGYLSHRQIPKQKSQQLYKDQISPYDWSNQPMQLSLHPAAVKAPGPNRTSVSDNASAEAVLSIKPPHNY